MYVPVEMKLITHKMSLEGLVFEQLSSCTCQLTNFLLENTSGEKADWLWEAKEETNEPPADWNKLPASSSEVETLCDCSNNTAAVWMESGRLSNRKLLKIYSATKTKSTSLLGGDL